MRKKGVRSEPAQPYFSSCCGNFEFASKRMIFREEFESQSPDRRLSVTEKTKKKCELQRKPLFLFSSSSPFLSPAFLLSLPAFHLILLRHTF